jgi:hypothetical protein
MANGFYYPRLDVLAKSWRVPGYAVVHLVVREGGYHLAAATKAATK